MRHLALKIRACGDGENLGKKPRPFPMRVEGLSDPARALPRGAHVVWAADRRRAAGAADETTVVESIVYLILVGLILGWQNGLDVNYIKLISLTSFVSPRGQYERRYGPQST